MKMETRLAQEIKVTRIGSLVMLQVDLISTQLTINEAREVAAMLEAIARTAESTSE